MSSDELIKELFTNFVGNGDTPAKVFLLNQRIDENTKKLNQAIKKKHKSKLETLCKDYEEVNLMQMDNAFVRGFSFGVQLMAEAFNQKL